MIVAYTASTEKTSVKNAHLANRLQFFSSSGVFAFADLKYASTATKEALKKSNAKKCPILPGRRCSPMNCMAGY